MSKVICLFIAAAVFLQFSGFTDNKVKPNIIFILADDLGYGDLGVFGQETIQTPNLDKMAKDGLKFNHHYAGSTVCAPSRSCLLSGLHTGHTYIRGNGPVEMRRDPQDITIAKLLKDGGYKTALIGKSGIGSNSQNASLVNEKGFDYFFGFTSHSDAHFYFPKFLYRNSDMIEYPKNNLHDGDSYSTDLFTGEALKFLEQNKQNPFFLHLAYQIPHASLYVKEKYKATYRDKVVEPQKGKKQSHYTDEDEPKATYAGMVTYLDEQVGIILDKIRELGIEKNTLVIFSSDNGPASEGGYHYKYFNSNGGLNGGKRDMTEGGLRVPTIAWWVGTIKAGRESNHISAFWDFLPTALEVAGLPPRDGIDGISYKNELLGLPQKQHEYLYWEFHEQGGKQAVLLNEYKGIRLDTLAKDNQPIALYNLKNDPAEQNNIAEKHPEIVSKIAEIMKNARTPNPMYPLPDNKK